MKITLFSKACVIALGLGLVPVWPLSVVAQDTNQKESPSDRIVALIMSTAFSGMPEKLPNNKGEMITLDLSDPKKYMIPFDDARRIIRRAYMSAKVDLCGLRDLERRHFKSIMRYELALKKWTSYQLTYIDILHATTGAVMTGSYTVGEDAKKKDDPSKDRRITYKCSPEERERWKAVVAADIKKSIASQ